MARLLLFLLLAAPLCAREEVRDLYLDTHAVYLEGKHVLYTVRPRGEHWSAPTRVPIETAIGPWGGVVRIAVAGRRVLVLGPTSEGFALAATDDGGKTWQVRGSRALTGHEQVESQRIVADGPRVYLTWIDEHAAKTPGDAVARPLYLAISDDHGRTFAKPRVATAGYPAACPCCVPALVLNGRTLLIAYRTSVANVKEVALLASPDGGRTFTYRQVSDDRWTYMGCPAKAPEIEARGNHITVKWVREKTPRTASSTDGGRTFTRP